MKTNKHFSLSWRTLMTYLLLFFASINIAFAQEGEDDVTECPYFSVSSTDSIGVGFSLISTDIEATISGVIANVVVEQTYYNAGDVEVDATYVFPMSTNAAIYGMEMILNDETIVAEIKRKAEAETIFENADSTGLTASLLEQEKPNVFQMSLANIQPGDDLSIRMVYTELLIPTNGVYQFVFPSIVGPRFTTGGEPWVNQAAIDAIPLSATALNINLKINGGMTVNAACTSHSTTFDYDGNSAETILNTNPGNDFIVNYTLDHNDIETGLLLYEGEEENFFLSMIQPAMPDVAFDSPQREYVFIMDVSGSMSGTPIETSKTLITNLLNDLNLEDKFNILFFAGGAATLSPNSLPVTGENIDMAIDMIEGINAGGSTMLLPAMQQALDMEGTEGYSRTFVILTDGYVTVEKEAYELIRDNLNEANFFSFGIGTSVNRFIIEGIAYVGEGEPFIVTDETDAAEMAATFKEYIEKPVLTNIEAIFEGIDVYDVEPLTIPDVFAERPIIIYGKYNSPAEGSIAISGDYADGGVASSLDFADYTDNMEENIALQYLWARKKIKLMSDYGIASNETDTISIEEEITQLGLKYSLVTEFTSFVAVDSSAVTTTSGGTDGTTGDDFNGVGIGFGGGIISDVKESYTMETGKDYMQILGQVIGAEKLLKLQLQGIKSFEDKSLSLQITSLNGQVLSIHTLNVEGLEDILSLSVGELPSGLYLASLKYDDKEILDVEKFIVK